MAKKDLISDILSIPSESRTLGGVIVFGVDDPQKATKKGIDRVFGIEENLELFDEIGHTIKKISPPLPDIWPPDLIEVDDKNVRIGLLEIPKVGDGIRSIENHVYIRQEKGNRRLSHQEDEKSYLFIIDKSK